MYQFGNHIEYYYFIENIYLSSQRFSEKQRRNYNDPMEDTYTRIKQILSIGPGGSGGSILDFIFSFIQLKNLDINDIKEDIANIFYYLLNYNDGFILEYYKNYGAICLFFLKDLPNYIIYDDYTKNERLMDDYPEQGKAINYKGLNDIITIYKLRNIEYIIKLSKDKKKYEEKSKNIIKQYLPKYIEYFKNTDKKLGNIINNKNKNKIMKLNEIVRNHSNNNQQNGPKNPNMDEPIALLEVINKATALLTQGVYFAT